jgi:glycosyltransferase involved in cell wall biosynthesis
MRKLKIIVVNKYLYPRGGDCIYTLRLMDLLAGHGHTVIPFGMHHPENIETEYSKYFVPYIDFREELKRFGLKSALKVMTRAIVNTEAAALLEKLIVDVCPDIIHLNNIHHQLTPSILESARKHGVPVVWTLHDYILNCPDHDFLRHGAICTKCADGNNIHAVIHRCKKGSLGASLIAAIESSYHNPRKLASMVKTFISPSRFLADVLIKHGLPDDQVVSVPNFLPETEINSTGDDYFLYFGRLSDEKGVDTLIKALGNLGRGRLLIAGDGPYRRELEKLAESYPQADIKFIGYQPPVKIIELIAGCRASILPSLCWDNYPYSVLETMMAGKPVIASRTGGIPEQVEHRRTGLLFTPGNSAELSNCIAELLDDRETAETMGKVGRTKVRRECSPETHYERIMDVYSNAIGDVYGDAKQLNKDTAIDKYRPVEV